MILEPPALDARQTQLLEKASSDNAFRQKLLENPKATIEQELGVKIKPGLEIQVVEETPTRICLVLPMLRVGKELSDKDLERAAGGVLPTPLPRGTFGLDRLFRLGTIHALTPIQIP